MASTGKPGKAAIYARISADDERDGRGVARQEADCRALAERLGWSVGRVHIDNDTSAYKRKRRERLPDGRTVQRTERPGFSEMLAEIHTGKADGLIVYDLDRLARDPRDLEDVIDLIESSRVPCQSVSGSFDLATDGGVTMARVMVAVANKSSRDISRRVKRKHEELAAQGKVSGGGTRPFGYADDRVTVIEREAEAIRLACHRVLHGWSMLAITKDFNEKGIATSTGGQWHRAVLTKVLKSPRIAGYRASKGKPVMGEDGHPVQAAWPAIVDPETWERVRETLADPARSVTRRNPNREYLLNIVRCGKCGARCYGSFRDGKRKYKCPTTGAHGYPCGAVQRVAEPIERHVEAFVLPLLEATEKEHRRRKRERGETDIPTRALDADVSGLEERLATLQREWASGNVSDAVFFPTVRAIEQDLASKRQERAQVRRSEIRLPEYDGTIREAWPDVALPEKRRLIGMVLSAVKLLPKPANAPKRFDSEYVALVVSPDLFITPEQVEMLRARGMVAN